VVRDVLPVEPAAAAHTGAGVWNFGLPLVGPLGIPTSRIAILRKTLLDLCNDGGDHAEVAGRLKAGRWKREGTGGVAPDVVTAYGGFAAGTITNGAVRL
jgi:hypothetical protein